MRKSRRSSAAPSTGLLVSTNGLNPSGRSLWRGGGGGGALRAARGGGGGAGGGQTLAFAGVRSGPGGAPPPGRPGGRPRSPPAAPPRPAWPAAAGGRGPWAAARGNAAGGRGARGPPGGPGSSGPAPPPPVPPRGGGCPRVTSPASGEGGPSDKVAPGRIRTARKARAPDWRIRNGRGPFNDCVWPIHCSIHCLVLVSPWPSDTCRCPRMSRTLVLIAPVRPRFRASLFLRPAPRRRSVP